MKKIFFSAFIAVLLFSLISCTINSPSANSDNTFLESLEAQISDLKKHQSEYEVMHGQLSESIAAIESISTDSNSPSATDIPTKNVGFQYTVEAQGAIITGYVGNEVNRVIPSSIDGYDVYAI